MILNKNLKNNRGQGLLEAVIALSIIVTGLVGALSLAVSNLSNSNDSVQRVIAGNLAREGVEVVRNIRDSNWLAGEEWGVGLFSEDDSNDHTAIIRFLKEENNWQLKFGEEDEFDEPEILKITDDYLYNHETGSATNFFRLITIDEICAEESECGGDGICSEGEEGNCTERIGVRVISEVQWKDRGKTRNLVIEDKLYNWR